MQIDPSEHFQIQLILNTVNDYQIKINSVTQHKAKGLSIEEIDRLVKVDDSEAIESLKILQDKIKKEELKTFKALETYRFFYKRKPFYILISLIFLTVFMAIYELYILVDVSKNSERFYRSLFEVINQPILVLIVMVMSDLKIHFLKSSSNVAAQRTSLKTSKTFLKILR